MRITVTVTVAAASAIAGGAAAMGPANPDASESARKVLSWIAGLPQRTDNRVISGQHLSHGIRYAATGYAEYVEALHAATGKWVAMVGADYGCGSSAQHISDGNRILIEYWNAGGLVTIDYHVHNPWTGGNAWDLAKRDLTQLIDPGSDVCRTWMAELDKVAAGLAELRDAGVVVLWRPFHEHTYKRCFWWDCGAHHPDPEPFKRMWRHMFDYLTLTKGLDNLLWVFCAANQDTWVPADFCYPGDEYVDVLGIDSYGDRFTIRGSGYERFAARKKPFAVTETGSGGQRDGTFDNMNVINRIRDDYPLTAFFQLWHSWSDNAVAIMDNRNAAALLNDPWVVTRDEVDWRSVVLTRAKRRPAATKTGTPRPRKARPPSEAG